MAVASLCKLLTHGRRRLTMEKLLATLFCVILCICAHPLESKRTTDTRIRPNKNFLNRNFEEYNLLANQLDSPDDYQEYLKNILVPRVAGSKEIENVFKYIVKELQNLDYHVEIDEFEDVTPHGKKTFRNIIGTFDNSKKKKLVLAAHYDSKYFPTQKNQEQFVGATDSAVPCAILLDLAKQLNCLISKEDMKPVKDEDITLQLVFFDGEEAFEHWTRTDSTYGSRHLAKLWEKPDADGTNKLDHIKYLVLLDLIGTRDVQFVNYFRDTQKIFETLPQIEKRLKGHGILNATKGEKLFDLSINFQYGAAEDDHIPFLERGVNILHLIPFPFPSVWHKITDNKNALDDRVTGNFIKIFRVFVSNELGLQAKKVAPSCRKK